MTTAPSLLRSGLSPEDLARAIFKTEMPEEAVRALPAQSAYLAIKSQGIDAAGDLIALLTPEQLRVCLDFDLWQSDEFAEENFWDWLTQSDEEESLKAIQRLIATIDLKLIALIMSRHVHTVVFDEPTDQPPGPHYYTPDKGYTWVFIDMEDSERHRLLGKLLAFLFESSAELFYQLMSIPGTTTESELVESAFQDKVRRLSDEDIPDPETAHKIHSPMRLFEVRPLLQKATKHSPIEAIPVIEPLIYTGEFPDKIGSLADQIRKEGSEDDRLSFESELTLILNSAIQRFAIPFSDYEAVRILTAKVKGALNVGLELASKECTLSLLEIHSALGLQGTYRLGLEPLMTLGRTASRLPKEIIESTDLETGVTEVLTATRKLLPEYPLCLASDGSFIESNGQISVGSRAIFRLSEIETLNQFFNLRFKN